MLIKTLHKIFICLYSVSLLIPTPVYAQDAAPEIISQPQEERLEAIITDIEDEKQIQFDGKTQLYQKLILQVTEGTLENKKLTIENGNIPSINVLKYEKGDTVQVTISKDPEGNNVYYIGDYIRRSSLLWLFGLFVALTILIGRKRGFTSLIGMGISFLVIFKFILPQVLADKDPVIVTILASLIIIPTTFYLSHGINKKTSSAIIATLISLIFIGVLANFFVTSSKLTGYASEESGFLQAATGGNLNIKALLLSGIIVGILGILNDITVSQAAVVCQLKKASANMKFKELYNRAMDVGRDHIASMVNTMVLAYTGVALPLLLLFINNPHPAKEIINYEIIAEEVVRTLVASIGLIIAVPITTLITALFVANDTGDENLPQTVKTTFHTH